MKKFFTLIAMLGLSAVCLVMLTGCPGEKLGYNEGRWRVENGTGQDLIFKTPGESRSLKVAQTTLFSKGFADDPYFKGLFAGYYDERVDFSWVEVYSLDGALLKRWKLSEKDEPGKQFFNSSSWDYYKEESTYIYGNWTFKIAPEDIVQTP